MLQGAAAALQLLPPQHNPPSHSVLWQACYKALLPRCSSYLTRCGHVDLASGGLPLLLRLLGDLEPRIFRLMDSAPPRRDRTEFRAWRDRRGAVDTQVRHMCVCVCV